MNQKFIPLLFLFLSALAFAKDVPKSPVNYILDEPSVLSNSATTDLSQKLKNFEEKTSNQAVIAIFNSLDNENLEDYTNKVFHEWKIGEKNKNNGILIALFYKEHKVRIEVGYGLEPVITDAYSKDIILSQIGPNLKNQNFELALNQAFDRIAEKIESPNSGIENKPKTSIVINNVSVNPVAVIIGIIALLGLMFLLHFMGIPVFDIVWFILNIISTFTGGEGKGGGGGGFSGGGGDSGGGGASGDW
jgi:uncharacterized protein